MDFHSEEHKAENGGFAGLNGTRGQDECMDGFEGIVEGKSQWADVIFSDS